jgi:Uncharacterized protein conserved in bacteria
MKILSFRGSCACLTSLLIFAFGFPGDVAGESNVAFAGADAPVLAGASEENLEEDALKLANQGDFEHAVTAWLKASELYAAQGNTRKQVRALIGLAQAYRALGLRAQSLEVLQRALPLAQASSDRSLKASVMGSLGDAYFSLGMTEQARTSLESSLILAREIGDLEVLSVSLNNLANVLASQGKYQEAQLRYSESAELAAKAKNSILAAQAATNRARTAVQQNEWKDAREWLAGALRATQSLNDSHDKVYGLISIGELYRTIGRQFPEAPADSSLKAYETLKEAARIAEALGDARASSYAWGYLGSLYEDRGRYEEALQLTQRAEFSAQLANAPESLYRWQWQAGRLLKARGDIEDAIEAYRRAIYNLQSLRHDLSLVERKGSASFRRAFAPIYFELADLLLQRPASLTNPQQIERYLSEARDTVELLKAAELEDYFQDDCVTELKARVARLDRLEPQTAAIYPILLADRTELLLTLPGGIKQFTVPVRADVLTAKVREFRKMLEKRTTHQYLPHARTLYEWLIRPLETELEAHAISTLVFVPDGPLRTIPMAALHDGRQFLINKYAFATTPGLTLTDPHPFIRENIEVLLSGLSVSVQGFPSLPYVAGELDTIRSLYAGKVLKDRAFQMGNVEQALTNTPYSVVHIASHGQFKSDPRQTFILTFEDKLSMDALEQVMGLGQFRDKPVELLTLSACQTAAGDDRAALGLAGIAVKAGARSALATLWFVNDRASSLLVAEFYRAFQDPVVSKAQALQRAQLTMLKDRRYRHPGYWSPFLLIGNWL